MNYFIIKQNRVNLCVDARFPEERKKKERLFYLPSCMFFLSYFFVFVSLFLAFFFLPLFCVFFLSCSVFMDCLSCSSFFLPFVNQRSENGHMIKPLPLQNSLVIWTRHLFAAHTKAFEVHSLKSFCDLWCETTLKTLHIFSLSLSEMWAVNECVASLAEGGRRRMRQDSSKQTQSSDSNRPHHQSNRSVL